MEVVGTETNLVIKTINGSEFHNTTVLTDLVVTDLDGNNSVKLPRTFTRDEIPASEEEIPRPESIRNWHHLQRIADEIPAYIPGVTIENKVKEVITPKDLNRMLELEFHERPGDNEYAHSHEDKIFLKKMQTECTLMDGHYQLLATSSSE